MRIRGESSRCPGGKLEPVRPSRPDRSSGIDPTSQSNRFQEIVVPEIPALLRAANVLTRNHHDAEDLVQDTLTRAYRFISGFDGRFPRAWLMTIMRNAHQSRVRKKRPDPIDTMSIPNNVATAGSMASAEESVMISRFSSFVETALGELPEKLRVAVQMVDVAGLSYEDAASALDISVSALTSRLHRARNVLRRVVEGETQSQGVER